MRDLTEDEIKDYLEFIQKSQTRPPEFNQDQALLIGRAFLQCGIMAVVRRSMVDQVIALDMSTEEMTAENLLLSLLVWSFQLGRECESRLFTLALKKTKVWTQ